jgi:hypothetical protein
MVLTRWTDKAMNPQIVDCSLQIRILERVPLIFDPPEPPRMRLSGRVDDPG